RRQSLVPKVDRQFEVLAEILGEHLYLFCLDAFGAAHPEWESDNDFLHIIFTDEFVEIVQVVFLVLAMKSLETLGRNPERIGDRDPDAAGSDVQAKNAMSRCGSHERIIEGLPVLGFNLSATPEVRLSEAAYRRNLEAIAVLVASHGFSVRVHILVVLFNGAGEAVMSFSVGHKVVILRLGWMHGRLQRAAARVRDRSRRQSGVAVGVIGR